MSSLCTFGKRFSVIRRQFTSSITDMGKQLEVTVGFDDKDEGGLLLHAKLLFDISVCHCYTLEEGFILLGRKKNPADPCKGLQGCCTRSK